LKMVWTQNCSPESLEPQSFCKSLDLVLILM
jgi:hypothetical protein